MSAGQPPKKPSEPNDKDELLQTTDPRAIELTEEQLDKVSGGRAKTADKAFAAMDKYIRG